MRLFPTTRLNLRAVVLFSLISSSLLWAGQYKVIYTFQGGNDGSEPYAALISDSAGNLYGTTVQGGTGTGCSAGVGCGTVYKLSPNGDGTYTESILYNFTGLGGDGAFPTTLLLGPSGTLVGITGTGGPCDAGGCGSVFQLTPTSGGNWTETQLYNFPSFPDGDGPNGLVAAPDGSYYGSTIDGGPGNVGNLFHLTPNGDGTWSSTTIYNFAFGSTGFNPTGLTWDGHGNLWGTTISGGVSCKQDNNGCGVVFELTPSGSNWNYNVVYSFKGLTDGGRPSSVPTFNAAGDLYGSTYGGGDPTCKCGVIYKGVPNGDGTWTTSVIHRFTGVGADGKFANGGLAFDATGNLWGTTTSGSFFGFGGVFEGLASGGGFQESLVHAFRNVGDGAFPYATLMVDSSGKVFGAANNGGIYRCGPPNFQGCGSVFQITP